MKKSLKITFNTFFIFIFFIVLVTFVATAFYAVYSTCTTIVAGQKASLFSFNLFVRGVTKVLPVVLVFSSLTVLFYMVRHYSTNIFPVAVYAVLYLSAWIFLLPLVLSIDSKAQVRYVQSLESVNVSSGYFRTDGDYVLYYSDVSEDNTADGVCFDLSGTGEEIYTFRDLSLKGADEGFTDSLVEKSVKIPVMVKILLSGFEYIIFQCKKALSNGFIAWLCFCSMGLALCSVSGLRHVSAWRLINTVLMIFIFCCVIVFNMLTLAGVFFTPASNLVCSWFKSVPDYINSFLVICNTLLAALLTVAGVIIRRRAVLKGEA